MRRFAVPLALCAALGLAVVPFSASPAAAAADTTDGIAGWTERGSYLEGTLGAGELYNNSFDAVSPDTQWLVSGEWGTMSHLQISPTPLLNPATSSDGGPLDLSGGDVTGHVVDLGSIPQSSDCSGTYEAEGVDYDPGTGILRVEIIQPSVCEVVTSVYEYEQS